MLHILKYLRTPWNKISFSACPSPSRNCHHSRSVVDAAELSSLGWLAFWAWEADWEIEQTASRFSSLVDDWAHSSVPNWNSAEIPEGWSRPNNSLSSDKKMPQFCVPVCKNDLGWDEEIYHIQGWFEWILHKFKGWKKGPTSQGSRHGINGFGSNHVRFDWFHPVWGVNENVNDDNKIIGCCRLWRSHLMVWSWTWEVRTSRSPLQVLWTVRTTPSRLWCSCWRSFMPWCRNAESTAR